MRQIATLACVLWCVLLSACASPPSEPPGVPRALDTEPTRPESGTPAGPLPVGPSGQLQTKSPMKDDMPKDPPREGILQAEPADSMEAAPAILAVRAKLIETLNASSDDIEIIRVEKVRWPDGTLPMAAGATPRPDTFVRGYRMLFLAANIPYEGRSDLFGGRIVLVKMP